MKKISKKKKKFIKCFISILLCLLLLLFPVCSFKSFSIPYIEKIVVNQGKLKIIYRADMSNITGLDIEQYEDEYFINVYDKEGKRHVMKIYGNQVDIKE